MKKLVIIGASGHGKVAADIARYTYNDILFLDDEPQESKCLGYPVVGAVDTYGDYLNEADFFVAIGSAAVRRDITEMLLAAGAALATLVHPRAVVADSVTLGQGTVVMAGAIVNPDSRIGKGCIVNTSASVDHDCRLADYVHVSVGAHLAGTVFVGNATWVGAGAIVKNNVDICGDCMIGAGAVVVRSITESGTNTGVPARRRS